ncbi:translation initiation factor IF-2-like [Falco cherrug]|uniref:translation initiation factor IF-2-like n=1 Tax=Falco cherrug TaxID=345164 RepID=UPI00247924D1|nr:translation initiation factor IF-2-like [Falco cherrug]
MDCDTDAPEGRRRRSGAAARVRGERRSGRDPGAPSRAGGGGAGRGAAAADRRRGEAVKAASRRGRAGLPHHPRPHDRALTDALPSPAEARPAPGAGRRPARGLRRRCCRAGRHVAPCPAAAPGGAGPSPPAGGAPSCPGPATPSGVAQGRPAAPASPPAPSAPRGASRPRPGRPHLLYPLRYLHPAGNRTLTSPCGDCDILERHREEKCNCTWFLLIISAVCVDHEIRIGI